MEVNNNNLTRSGIVLSLIVPVYNRPAEVRELLTSLALQTDPDFELLIVEDGSDVPCDAIVREFADRLNVQYLSKPNSGPGPSRNFGAAAAKGNYFVFLDSDCVIPPGYVACVRSRLSAAWVDAFGGPDAAAPDFSDMQKAVSYSMTSFFTTGGIRGGGEKMDKFYPRSFNMGFSREVFEATGGFSGMRYGEDIDMSIRILEYGFQTALIKEAFVYHKRRTSLSAFFRQVYHSGGARIDLQHRHPGSLKAVHALPAIFTIGCAAILLPGLLGRPVWLTPLGLYALILFADSLRVTRSFKVALLSIVTSYTQLLGYGSGFLAGMLKK